MSRPGTCCPMVSVSLTGVCSWVSGPVPLFALFAIIPSPFRPIHWSEFPVVPPICESYCLRELHDTPERRLLLLPLHRLVRYHQSHAPKSHRDLVVIPHQDCAGDSCRAFVEGAYRSRRMLLWPCLSSNMRPALPVFPNTAAAVTRHQTVPARLPCAPRPSDFVRHLEVGSVKLLRELIDATPQEYIPDAKTTYQATNLMFSSGHSFNLATRLSASDFAPSHVDLAPSISNDLL